MKSDDERKVVLITGASRGIGREIALRFARGGYDIALTYSSEKSKTLVDEVVLSASASGSKAVAFKCDVSESAQVNSTVDDVRKSFERIDVLVNNAGITKDGLTMRMTDEQFDDVLNTNLKGAFYLIRSCLPGMIKARRGNIVNISSIVGIHGNPGQANYSASKAGIIGITKSVAKEVASRGIIVNAVAPGAIDTAMFSSLNEKIREAVISSIPLGRLGAGEEVADAVYFLANQSYITGQVVNVDGGMGI